MGAGYFSGSRGGGPCVIHLKSVSSSNNLNSDHDFENTFKLHITFFHRFIHCSPEEVEEYKTTGQMSPQIIVEASKKNQLPGIVPICKEFKKGLCRRNYCKYRHISKEQEEAEILEMINNNNNNNRKNPIILTNNSESQTIPIGSLNGK